jgi:hypothetical protein
VAVGVIRHEVSEVSEFGQHCPPALRVGAAANDEEGGRNGLGGEIACELERPLAGVVIERERHVPRRQVPARQVPVREERVALGPEVPGLGGLDLVVGERPARDGDGQGQKEDGPREASPRDARRTICRLRSGSVHGRCHPSHWGRSGRNPPPARVGRRARRIARAAAVTSAATHREARADGASSPAQPQPTARPSRCDGAAEAVVTLHSTDDAPMSRSAVREAPGTSLAVCRRTSVSPDMMRSSLAHARPATETWGAPTPATRRVKGPSKPRGWRGALSTTAPGATPSRASKAKGSGDTSRGAKV